MRKTSLAVLGVLCLFAILVFSQPRPKNAVNPTPTPILTAVDTKVSPVDPVTTMALAAEPAFPLITTSTPALVQTAAVDKIRQIMVDYGQVYEAQLSYEYWQKVQEQIVSYGPARRIPTFEYHGDEYNMYDGNYAMTQEQFREQMYYLVRNDYHFVTGPEIVGFVEGWLDLPARSVILTTDSGLNSFNSLTRMMALFDQIKKETGVNPHFNSFIWTQGMDDPTNPTCENYDCWDIYKVALSSGYFSFGSHTQSHGDFGNFTRRQTEWDLSHNLVAIHDGLGVRVYGIAWPLERCSPFSNILTGLGFRFAFGGNTRAWSELYTYSEDNMSLCLPRIFPPNPDGISGRPGGKTLEQILLDSQQ